MRPGAGGVERAVGGVDAVDRRGGCRRAARRPRHRRARCRPRPGPRSRGSRWTGARRITYCTGMRNGASASGPVTGTDSRCPSSVGPVVPGGVLGAARRRCRRRRRHRDRDDGVVGEAQGAGEPGEVLADRLERGLVVVDEVDLVDGQHQPRHPQQREHGGVPAGLLDDPVPGVDQQDRQLRGGRAGDRVAGVLHVAGGVGEHELARRRGEVAVGDVDRDALLALGAQAVDEQRQVGRRRPLSTDARWTASIWSASTDLVS